MKWCSFTNDGECRSFLQHIEKEKHIFLGDFVKGILKINNIVMELEKIYAVELPMEQTQLILANNFLRLTRHVVKV
jgi:hypothetical protein